MTWKIIISLLFVSIVASNIQAESLYSERVYRGLVTDTKAQHIGDSITVLVIETSNAETSNSTGSTESSDNALAANNGSNSESAALNTDSNYKNGGEVTRKGELLARMTVTIHEILPTGELRIKGEQKIQINDEIQTITLSGNVRPMDVLADNSVLSTRIANARIVYKGKGYTSDDSPGVITEFFRWLF